MMDAFLKFLPLAMQLASRGGDIAKIVQTVTTLMQQVQAVLPAPTQQQYDVTTAAGIAAAFKHLGYDLAEADVNRDAGRPTVIKFQEDYNKKHPTSEQLNPDGWIGTKTQAALAAVLGGH